MVDFPSRACNLSSKAAVDIGNYEKMSLLLFDHMSL